MVEYIMYECIVHIFDPFDAVLGIVRELLYCVTVNVLHQPSAYITIGLSITSAILDWLEFSCHVHVELTLCFCSSGLNLAFWAGHLQSW